MEKIMSALGIIGWVAFFGIAGAAIIMMLPPL